MGEDDFNPYVDNGGTVAAIAGEGFCIIAGDTRVSEGYGILTRNRSKIHPVNKTIALACSGMCADIDELWKVMDYSAKNYLYTSGYELNLKAFATRLHTVLYSRRFFPYYSFCLACGISPEGKGGVYTYDAVGNFEERPYSSQGSGSNLMLPLLDRVLRNRESSISEKEASETLIAAFKAAAERDIHTGDHLEIMVIRRDSVESYTLELRKD
eukprot:gnl/Chilomastix_caulleri/763.p1 GENE.gnl/Chilomastix_caulleri/763~~gnl/Chilomastix_caulleri/763.p1  ORF type:complete len:212 (-),score=29.73 gnl/Chilomastix_caulleri/763:39-674(-)